MFFGAIQGTFAPIASPKTFGVPSNFDVIHKTSILLINFLKGLFTKLIIFISLL